MFAKIQKTNNLQYSAYNFFVPLHYENRIIVAMDKEFEQLKAILAHSQTEHFNHKDFVSGQLGEKTVILQQCGIGKVTQPSVLSR